MGRMSVGDPSRPDAMLYFLHQRAPRDYPRLNLNKGAPMCKVLADSLDELVDWGRTHGFQRIHISRKGRPHYDLWGACLVLCPSSSDMKRHRDLYRSRILRW